MNFDIIGVYPVGAPEPCYLIELWVRGLDGAFDLPQITQAILDQPESYWQVPYDTKFLNEDGTALIGEQFLYTITGKGDFRIAFFFHYLDFSKPLLSSAGPLKLPEPSERPSRIQFFEYEPPF
jgi:hypothetical protein